MNQLNEVPPNPKRIFLLCPKKRESAYVPISPPRTIATGQFSSNPVGSRSEIRNAKARVETANGTRTYTTRSASARRESAILEVESTVRAEVVCGAGSPRRYGMTSETALLRRAYR